MHTAAKDMEKAFNDILEIKGVRGALLISPTGETVFRSGGAPAADIDPAQNGLDLEGLAQFAEADLFFENARIYVRPGPWGYLVVVMDHGAPAAMVRLNCDALTMALGNGGKPRRKARFFFRRGR